MLKHAPSTSTEGAYIVEAMASNLKEEQEKWTFGSKIPYAENSWAAGAPSPYYNDSHRQLRKALRAWMEEVIIICQQPDSMTDNE